MPALAKLVEVATSLSRSRSKISSPLSTREFADANPEITAMIKAYSLPTPVVNEMLAYYVDESGGDMEATAKNFLKGSSSWTKWVPADVAKKVKASL